MNQFLHFLVPDALDRALLIIGAVIGTVIDFLYGGWSSGLTWLGCLALVDFATGSIAAWQAHAWSSDAGSTGLKRKIVLWVFVAIAHGIDVTFAEAGFTALSFMSITVIALTVTEAGSIVENIDRMGNGKFVPAVIRRGLKAAQRVVDERVDKSFGEEEKKDGQA
jgi:toxin secretion/phage lysis holin